MSGDVGVDRCRIDHTDTYTNCERGNIFGESGEGFGRFRVNLSRDFELNAAGGPWHVLNINVVPSGEVGNLVRVIVRDTNRAVILDDEFAGETNVNRLIGGSAAEVEVLGASTWSIAFIKESAIAKNQNAHAGLGDDVFAIKKSSTETFAEVFAVQLLDDTLVPDVGEDYSGQTPGGTQYIAVFAPDTIVWAWGT